MNSYSVSCYLLTSVFILCLLGNFLCFFFRLLNFFKIIFFEKLFQEYHQSGKQFGFRSGPTFSNNLDSDQAQQNVGPDLDPNCLQRLSADDTSRQRINPS